MLVLGLSSNAAKIQLYVVILKSVICTEQKLLMRDFVYLKAKRLEDKINN